MARKPDNLLEIAAHPFAGKLGPPFLSGRNYRPKGGGIVVDDDRRLVIGAEACWKSQAEPWFLLGGDRRNEHSQKRRHRYESKSSGNRL